MGGARGGLGLAVIFVGMLLAASTGIVGATVVTMGLLALPVMLKNGYCPKLATGTICAAGTLGQMIPPSIVLVLLGDVISSAYQQAQLDQGIFSPEAMAVGDLFIGALIPGLMLVGLYMVYMLSRAWLTPLAAPATPVENAAGESPHLGKILLALLPPLALIFAVLGSILGGIATPTEAASVGAVGSLILAAMNRALTLEKLKETLRASLQTTSLVFMIFIGAAFFALVFKGFGGDELVKGWLEGLPGGVVTAMILVMLLMFLLGFFLDFIEITFVVVPIVAPILLAMGLDPVWLGVMIAMNLQTSFLTPPFGFSLFYLRGVTPPSVQTRDMYKGVMPFIAIQLGMLVILALYPELVTWLPSVL
jgi:tripartite ATP-independent transporter DctM subunit